MGEAPASYADTADFTFKIDELDTDVLKVLAFEGTEGISELFRFRVELCSDDANIDLNALLGKPCSLEIYAAGGARRYVSGIVRRFERMRHGSALTYYSAEIVPSLWLLTKRYQSRIFQEARCDDMTIPGVIAKVFDEAGIIADYYDPFVIDAGQYDDREFVAQYRESDFDFISRLMEHEGIFYFFEHTEGGHRVKIADSDSAHVLLPDGSEFMYRDPSGMVEESEHVFLANDRCEIQHGAVFLDDFNFRKSENAMWMRSEQTADKHTALIYNDYPGCFEETATGDRYARVRLEENRAASEVVHLSATVRTMTSGYRFTLVDHPTDSMNREYLITHVSHRATQRQSAQDEAGGQGTRYEAQVRAIPADVPYRCPRKTPRPVIIGSQTAVVVGPESEEIFTDDDGYGRVKVQFHWDRNGDYPDNASCWVRSSQGWAGGGYGMLFTPRIGQEVIVDFLEGNPDRPLITGRVYNNDNMPPYLPGEKTKSTIKTRSSMDGEGSNEIRFEDLKDQEQLLFHAQKDLHIRVKNDRVENVENDLHLTVANDKKELVKKAKHSEVRLDLNELVGGNKSLEVSGDVGEKFGGHHSEELKGNFSLKTGQLGHIVIEAGKGLTIKVGGSFVTIDSTGVSICGKTVKINSGGVAGSGSAVAVAAPEAPVEAEEVEYGTDTRYSGEESEYDQVGVESITGGAEREPREARKTSWIEIELVDELGRPIPGEQYEIVAPNGQTKRGRLDDKGQARVPVADPGECQISFPKLDAAAWERC